MGSMNGGGDTATARRWASLQCMFWACIGVLWTVYVGVPHSALLDDAEQTIGTAGLNSQPKPGKDYELSEDGNAFVERLTKGAGTPRFDQQRVHFVGKSSMQDPTGRGPDDSGHDQFAWLEKDLGNHPSHLPSIVFANTALHLAQRHAVADVH
ncbi:MAG: 3,5-cyclic-AMP phosphodiesterase [Acetobacteraceae bacterium]|jgi:hypothetical protein|nr:3,5-cyclic-AMP phosphodiesterase [Acetobacteraceae bacterium]